MHKYKSNAKAIFAIFIKISFLKMLFLKIINGSGVIGSVINPQIAIDKYIIKSNNILLKKTVLTVFSVLLFKPLYTGKTPV